MVYNVLPLKPGVGQYIVIHVTLTARDLFLASFYLSGPVTCYSFATIVASLQEGGTIPDSQMELKTASSRVNELSGRFVSSL